MDEQEYQSIKSRLEAYGNTIVTGDVVEIVSRLQNDGLDVIVRESAEMGVNRADNVLVIGRHTPERWYVLERVRK